VVIALFGFLGIYIIVSAVIAVATRYKTSANVWIPNLVDYGLTPGLVLLSTAVILFFMPRKS
jgi:hypothetical protein